MTHQPNDDMARLGRLLRDAVDDIEPAPGIEAIRARISPKKESSMTLSRTRFLGAFGAAVATAAVITAVAVVGNGGLSADKDVPPATSPTGGVSVPPTEDPSQGPTTEPTNGGGGAVPVYYVGDTARGIGLYREFHPNVDGEDPVFFAVSQAVGAAPDDPDYRPGWPDGADVLAVRVTPDLLSIDLTGDVHDRPVGMTVREAAIALEQLIYTAQAAYGQGRVPVEFLINGGKTDQVLGQPASEPLANGPVLETLSLVNLTTPAEGDVISGDTLDFNGVANSFEANVLIRLQRGEGNFIAFEGAVMAEGAYENKLFPFSGSIDISDVTPGTYVLTAMTDDPSGGAEGPGADSDTRTITIR